jgi:alkanesulfonate monooxygenase SsuD/methylene tetrahydromethanopterin reductase-like flavin-dependent oxidoreductase (luciferase family)
MQVGFASHLRLLPGRPELTLEKVYQDTLEVAILAEELGFSRFWSTESHFAEDAWMPSPLILLTAVAARTSRIRLGTYVTTIGFHNPIRFAEDAATLDLLSHGRLDIGFGAALPEYQAKSFNIDPKGGYERSYEAAAVVQKCFTEEEFSHEGKYYKFPNVRMTTKPVQKPHPPIYWGALGPKSLARSAERNYGIVSALLSGSWKENYLAKQQALGRARGRDFQVVSGPLFCHLAENHDQAWDESEEALHWLVEFDVKWGYPQPLVPLGEFRKPGNAQCYGLPMAVGTPDEALEILSRFRDEPMDEIVISLLHPGQDVAVVKRSMRLFAKEVMPELERWGRS